MRNGTFWLRYRTPSGIGKYILGFGLRIETGAERTTTIIVDTFDIINPASTRHRYSPESSSSCCCVLHITGQENIRGTNIYKERSNEDMKTKIKNKTKTTERKEQ